MKEHDDGLNAARGIIYAAVMAIPLWIAFATGLYFLFR